MSRYRGALRHVVRARCWLLAWITATLLGACATALPPLEGRGVSTQFADTSDTALGRAVAGIPSAPGRSGVHALRTPHDAFAARALLVRAAQRSLDIQYYIWHGDTTGMLLLAGVLRAAERGVRVRLLLDDNGIAGLDPVLAALDAHANVEVRLFNPFVQRQFKALGYLTDFRRVNRRMHNKSLTADSQATIVGGRNVGDAYFGADEALGFADLDVLALGPVAREVGAAFDVYWNSELAYPARLLLGSPAPDAVAALGRRLREAEQSLAAATYLDALRRATFVEHILAGRFELEWVPVRVLFDPPDKARRQTAESDLLVAGLARELGPARHSVELVSPYFVPGEEGAARLAQRAASGVRLRIVTNSLAATDVAAVHAGYAKRREVLVRAGVRLFELKPDAGASRATSAASWLTFTGSSTASLHGKAFAVDGRELFVGSFNLDPRSIRLNTEMGLVISSPTLAAGLRAELDRVLPSHAYEVRLADDGALEWIEQTAEGQEVRHRQDPRARFARRLGVSLLSILPIESLL